MTTKANYGLDAPVVVRRLVAASIVLVGAALVLWFLPATKNDWRIHKWLPSALTSGIACGLTASVMTWGSKVGKPRVRDHVLSSLAWTGDERVLDVGCGHGLMLLGAAKRLTGGKATGIDLWRDEDQAENSSAATLQNARCEGVADRIELRDADARALPFENESFDVVLSSWALHNIPDAAGRLKAVQEISRVLKPGGRAVLVDIRHTSNYAAAFRAAGFVGVRRSLPNFLFVTPTFTVWAEKPSATAAAVRTA